MERFLPRGRKPWYVAVGLLRVLPKQVVALPYMDVRSKYRCGPVRWANALGRRRRRRRKRGRRRRRQQLHKEESYKSWLTAGWLAESRVYAN
jgi:hypothetical protein